MAPSSSRYSTTATTTINMTKLVKTVPLGATVGKESQETNFQSPVWRGIRGDTVLICQRVIEEIVERKDEIPDQLFEAANIISETSSGIRSLNNHYKKDFQRLLGEASCLVVVLQQLYNNSRSLRSIWPPLGFNGHIKELIHTVYRVHGLMTRKCEKNLANRILVGCFGIRDLGKFKKYQRRLDSVASGLESKPNMININKVLLEFVKLKNRATQDIHTQLPEETPEETPASKPRNQKGKSEEVQESDSKPLRKKKGKSRAKDNSKDKPLEECSQESESPTTPLHQSSISGFIFKNASGESMTNHNVGNIYNSTVTGVGNDYSVTHFHARNKRVYT